MAKNVEFTKAMELIFHVAHEDMNDDIMEDVVYFSDKENEDFSGDNCEFAYAPHCGDMFYLIRDMMNYNWFWARNGKIDIENANRPEIAKAIEPFTTPELLIKVEQSF